MNARTRSAVHSDGERPRPIWHIRFGSPSALMPNAVGLKPVRPRNALTRVLNCCSSVFMPVTVKHRFRARQLLGNLLSACIVCRCPGTYASRRRSPPVARKTPPVGSRRRSCQRAGSDSAVGIATARLCTVNRSSSRLPACGLRHTPGPPPPAAPTGSSGSDGGAAGGGPFPFGTALEPLGQRLFLRC